MRLFNPLLLALLVTFTTVSSIDAANWTLLRRTVEVGACLASAADAFSTVAAVNAGAHETNSFLTSSSGKISYARLITFKSLVCATPIVISESLRRFRPDRREDYMSFGGSLFTTGLYSWAAWHNYRVADQLHQTTVVPAYLQ